MEIKFTLKDFEGKKRDFVLENIESVKNIIYTIICGDEVVFVTRNNEEQERYDSYHDIRRYDPLDEVRVITLEQLERLNRD